MHTCMFEIKVAGCFKSLYCFYITLTLHFQIRVFYCITLRHTKGQKHWILDLTTLWNVDVWDDTLDSTLKSAQLYLEKSLNSYVEFYYWIWIHKVQMTSQKFYIWSMKWCMYIYGHFHVWKRTLILLNVNCSIVYCIEIKIKQFAHSHAVFINLYYQLYRLQYTF